MILDIICRDKRKRLEQAKKNISMDDMKQMAFESKRCSISFYDALKTPGLSIIGEFKNASPSHGNMNNKIDLTTRIHQYNKSVDAISCLTEEDNFNGSVEYLKRIRDMTNLPILRKDFIFDEYQIYEAKVIKADAVLLIASILNDKEFKKLYDLAYELGMDVLCEVHNEEELKRMINMDVKIIGINNRNLDTFEVTIETTTNLTKLINKDKIVISESGITNDDDINILKECNVNGFLVGTALMETDNPGEVAKHWKDI